MINNVVKRGTVRTIKQRQIHHNKIYEYEQYTYSADADHQVYFQNRKKSGRRLKWLACDSFINWADIMMLNKGRSPDVINGRALLKSFFLIILFLLHQRFIIGLIAKL